MVDSPADIQCPVCGYYCLGKGGVGCINKPGLIWMTPRQKVAHDGFVDRFVARLEREKEIERAKNTGEQA